MQPLISNEYTDTSLPVRELYCRIILANVLDARGCCFGLDGETRAMRQREAYLWLISDEFEILCDDLDLPCEEIRDYCMNFKRVSTAEGNRMLRVFEQRVDREAKIDVI